jgi:VWFA-related protein
VALDVVNDKGIENAVNFSSDGNWISAALHEEGVGIRDLGPAGGYWGATERLQISLKALSQIVERDGSLPGRKIVLWVSPGWPLLNEVNTGLNAAQRQQLFESIVGISTDLRRARITLYSIDPLGAGESTLRTSYYENFLKGVSKPSQVDPGDVGLQVIAVQSGGLALNSGNDITMFLQECVADAAPYYEISFAAPAAQRPDEYHQVEIKIDKPGLSARAREGYYAQPSTVPGN